MTKYEKLIQAWKLGKIDLAPITKLLNIKPVDFAEGIAKIEMCVGQQHHNALGTVHGGIYCDFADVAIGLALATVLKEKQNFTTLQLQMNYFHSIVESQLIATAKIIRHGRTTAYLECEIHDNRERMIAKAISTCMIFSSTND